MMKNTFTLEELMKTDIVFSNGDCKLELNYWDETGNHSDDWNYFYFWFNDFQNGVRNIGKFKTFDELKMVADGFIMEYNLMEKSECEPDGEIY